MKVVEKEAPVGEWPQNQAVRTNGRSHRVRSAAAAVSSVIAILLRSSVFAAPRLRFASLSLRGSRLVLVLAFPRLRWFR